MIENKLQWKFHKFRVDTAAPILNAHDSLIEQTILPLPSPEIEVPIHPDEVITSGHDVGGVVDSVKVSFCVGLRDIADANERHPALSGTKMRRRKCKAVRWSRDVNQPSPDPMCWRSERQFTAINAEKTLGLT